MNTKLARTVLSIWSWIVLGLLVGVFAPLVAVTRLVTMPFEKGAYATGYLFRKLTVVHAVHYTHLRAHETGRKLVCRLLHEKKKSCGVKINGVATHTVIKGFLLYTSPSPRDRTISLIQSSS